MWFSLICEALKALLVGEFSRWLAAHRAKKAQDAKNDDLAASDDDVAKRLSKWTKR